MEPRKSKKKKKKNEITEEEEKPQEDFEVSGVCKIHLSRLTQKAVGCEVHKDVTSEDPWTYVKKEHIEDNIDLHAESSEFLPWKDEIYAFKKEKVLVGFNREVLPNMSEFYFCLTNDAEETVQRVIKRQKSDLQVRLKKCIVRPALPWTSLGSDAEIDSSIVRNFRPLIEVEIPLAADAKKEPILGFRFVADSDTGYVELSGSRFNFDVVRRRRKDGSVQVAPQTAALGVQTNPKYPKNVWTQYDYKCSKVTVNDVDLQTFLGGTWNYLEDAIVINYELDMYKNDYEELAAMRRGAWGDYVEECQFSKDEDPYKIDQITCLEDLITCKGYNIADFDFCPHYRNVQVVAYKRYAANYVHTEEPMNDRVRDAVYNVCPVLVWSVKDKIRPTLYLQTHRDVNVIKYCPYETDLVIGGCVNGQIILWDLQDRLHQVENKPILTAAQEKNRTAIYSLLGWMNNDYNIAVVKATAISSLRESIGDEVTVLKFISPDWEITKMGNFAKLDDKAERSLILLTLTSNGYFSAWNLKDKPTQYEKKASVKLKRLKNFPSDLARRVSPYAELNKKLKPYFRLQIENANRTKSPLLSLSMVRSVNQYIPMTYRDEPYYLFDHCEPVEYKNEFFATNKLGELLHITWQGSDYDTGSKLQIIIPNVKTYKTYHDGPIIKCQRHFFYPNILLTVGAGTWSVWDTNNLEEPVYYIKNAKSKYVDGNFVPKSPVYILVVREDGVLEYWNFTESTHYFERAHALSCDGIQRIFINIEQMYNPDRNLAISDKKGTARVYSVPKRYLFNMPKDEIVKMKKQFSREEIRTKVLNEWKENWYKNYVPQEMFIAKSKEPIDDNKLKPKEEKVGEPTKTDKWLASQEKFMLQTLLKKKNLDINEIMKQKEPLDILNRSIEQRHKKVERAIEHADEKYEAAKKVYLSETQTTRIQRYVKASSLDPSFIKETYEEAEEKALQFMEGNPYESEFTWCRLLNDGYRRRSIIREWANAINVSHLRRRGYNIHMLKNVSSLMKDIIAADSRMLDISNLSTTDYFQNAKAY